MTASLAYLLGGGNGLVWSWFFWVYIHPVASITWFAFCLFALLISLEVCQLEEHKVKAPSFTLNSTSLNPKPLNNLASNYVTKNYSANSEAFRATEVIEVIVQSPPQLPYSKMHKAKTQHQNPEVTILQLPSSTD